MNSKPNESNDFYQLDNVKNEFFERLNKIDSDDSISLLKDRNVLEIWDSIPITVIEEIDIENLKIDEINMQLDDMLRQAKIEIFMTPYGQILFVADSMANNIEMILTERYTEKLYHMYHIFVSLNTTETRVNEDRFDNGRKLKSHNPDVGDVPNANKLMDISGIDVYQLALFLLVHNVASDE